jgi:hypothetical protein
MVGTRGLALLAAVIALAGTTGCGATSAKPGSRGDGQISSYPLASEPGPVSMHAVSGPNGSTLFRPALPTTFEQEPTPTCQRTSVEDGTGATHTVVVPPTPGLRADAISEHRTKVTWWFNDVPSDCRPALMLISVSANDDPRATPLTLRLPFTGESGSKVIDYGSFLDPPDVALASAELPNGLSSGTTSVLIRRP